MKLKFFALVMALACVGCSKPANKEPEKPVFEMPGKAIVLAEQATASVAIMNAETNVIVWQWKPEEAGLTAEEQEWFVNPSEVKPVCDGTCVLMTASNGAVALIRIADKALLFYGKCEGFPNPHSAELLPDENIVAVESRSGHVNIFVREKGKVTAGPFHVATVADAHNVVWNKTHNCLFMTGRGDNGKLRLYSFDYDPSVHSLTNRKEVYSFSNESGGHDLYPVYGEENRMWLSAANGVYRIDVTDAGAPSCEKMYNLLSVKSVSDSPYGTVMLKPTESWWSDGLVNEKGERLFLLPGTKIYKGRWWIK